MMSCFHCLKTGFKVRSRDNFRLTKTRNKAINGYICVCYIKDDIVLMSVKHGYTMCGLQAPVAKELKYAVHPCVYSVEETRGTFSTPPKGFF